MSERWQVIHANGAAFVCFVDTRTGSGACLELRGNQAREASTERGVIRLARKLRGRSRDAVAKGVGKGWRKQ